MTSQSFTLLELVLILAVAAALDYFLVVRLWHRRKVVPPAKTDGVIRVLGVPSPLLTWLRKLWPQEEMVRPQPLKFNGWMAMEIVILAVWAIWVGRLSLDFSNPGLYPAGSEFPLVTETHSIWTLLPQCGSCVLWNGFINGGSPAFAEVQGAVLHPLVILTTLFWGMLNGTRILLVICLFLIGLSQWWLAYVMRLGWLPRLWAGLMAITAGVLLEYIENGDMTLLLSIASAMLVLPPLLDLALNHNRRAVVWLAAAMALTWLGGQGYIQVGMLVGWLPAALLLGDRRAHPLWRDLLAALGLSALLVGVLAVPLLHFLPNVVKLTDGSSAALLPAIFPPSQLFSQDSGIYFNSLSGTRGLSYIYIVYVGSALILLALAALRPAWKSNRRLLGFFCGGTFLLFAINSTGVLRWLVQLFPTPSDLYTANVSAALVAPLLLALSAWGLEWLMHLGWPKMVLGIQQAKHEMRGQISIAWVIMIPSLALTIYLANEVSRPLPYQVSVAFPAGSVEALQPDRAEWVAPVYGEYIWTPQLLAHGVKMTDISRSWQWGTRDEPQPYLEVIRNAAPMPGDQTLGPFKDITVFVHPENEYAVVQAGGSVIPCVAQSHGGNIDVSCNSSQSGVLVVQENSWDGWQANVDGHSASLLGSTWLSVAAPAGQHTFSFRYRPWDVWVGLLLTLSGIILEVWWWPEDQAGRDRS